MLNVNTSHYVKLSVRIHTQLIVTYRSSEKYHSQHKWHVYGYSVLPLPNRCVQSSGLNIACPVGLYNHPD